MPRLSFYCIIRQKEMRVMLFFLFISSSFRSFRSSYVFPMAFDLSFCAHIWVRVSLSNALLLAHAQTKHNIKFFCCCFCFVCCPNNEVHYNKSSYSKAREGVCWMSGGVFKGWNIALGVHYKSSLRLIIYKSAYACLSILTATFKLVCQKVKLNKTILLYRQGPDTTMRYWRGHCLCRQNQRSADKKEISEFTAKYHMHGIPWLQCCVHNLVCFTANTHTRRKPQHP